MRVDTPTLLAVLAHEIRSPVSVLQGYLRLLEQQRPANGPEGAMLEAMRKSTARLAALGRDASDLSGWLDAAPRSQPASVTVGDLLADFHSRAPLAIMTAVDEHTAQSPLETRDSAMLGRALAALVMSVSRDHDNAPCPVDVAADEHHILVRIRPGVPGDDEAAARTADEPPPDATPPFNRGGMGLQLVLASHVLASHGARVSTTAPGGLDVSLPRREARP